MKIFVDEMPGHRDNCPLSEVRFDKLGYAMNPDKEFRYVYHYCNFRRDRCDLNNGVCSGLRTVDSVVDKCKFDEVNNRLEKAYELIGKWTE